ncbi:type II toxin-antitoxin system RelE/ParE family toxin [Pseudomonas tohonis]|uniref:type II toxin-antitoxin system RelE/ParE family toxin n=1 Tax=Pseudomonas tohonis TaxID=2725477 RepID=UPI0022F0655F|nr:type II toxin-antitoxin system RelE/ParE family toxin [Pseudomonas tohonis]
MSKPVKFCGSSLDDIRSFPDEAKSQCGYEIDRVQKGLEPTDWKPFKTIGPGVKEIRIQEDSGAFRVFFVEDRKDFIYVLHAVRKTTQKTEKRDIDLAKARYKELPD